MKRLLLVALPLLLAFQLRAQGTPVPLWKPSYHILDRLEIKTGIEPTYHSGIKPWLGGDMVRYALRIDTTSGRHFTAQDRRDLYYIFKDQNEWLAFGPEPTLLLGRHQPAFVPAFDSAGVTYYRRYEGQAEASQADFRYVTNERPLLGIFYQTPANFFQVDQPHFFFRANPMLNLRVLAGKDEEFPVFDNVRGLEMRAGLDDRIYLYTNIVVNDFRAPQYLYERYQRDRAVPGAGLVKPYRSTVFDFDRGLSVLTAQGIVGMYLSKHVGLQFGHGQNFIGNGYRSMLLSDFATNYLFLKLNWRIWKFHYQNIFAELISDPTAPAPRPRKYLAAHYFHYRLSPKLAFGFYEATVLSRKDHFDFEYLNPVILYRTIEHLVGSPDNVLIGIDAKWNLLHRFQLYGQLMMDEFKLDELILDNRGWWANKFGVQLGLKYVDVLGIDHLDLQVEFNTARPYTYTHRDSSNRASYTHYHQSLAHPLGANFREWLAIARYQPHKRIQIEGRFFHQFYGEDPPGENWGGNILLSHKTRQQDYGNVIGQGIATTNVILAIDASYALYHNMWLDFHFFRRAKNSEDDARDATEQYIGAGLRMNSGLIRMEY